MQSDDLRWKLESWLQFNFGARAVLNSRPLKGFIGIAFPELEKYTWLEIMAEDLGAPEAAGIRHLTEHDRYEIVEWSRQGTLKRSVWRQDGSHAWYHAS